MSVTSNSLTATNEEILEKLETSLSNLKKWMKSMSEPKGLDINIERKSLSVDRVANGALNSMGKNLTPPGSRYIGTLAIHMYISGTDIHQSGGEMHAATQFSMLEGISLPAVRSILDTARVDILNFFKPKKEK